YDRTWKVPGNAVVYSARAAYGRARRCQDGPIQLLRRSVSGALRRSAIHRRDGRDPPRGDEAAHPQTAAEVETGPFLAAPRPLEGVESRPGRPIRGDAQTAWRAP